jgi:hypothetical protein
LVAGSPFVFLIGFLSLSYARAARLEATPDDVDLRMG